MVVGDEPLLEPHDVGSDSGRSSSASCPPCPGRRRTPDRLRRAVSRDPRACPCRGSECLG
jgi:hypothetical protein